MFQSSIPDIACYSYFFALPQGYKSGEYSLHVPDITPHLCLFTKISGAVSQNFAACCQTYSTIACSAIVLILFPIDSCHALWILGTSSIDACR